MASGKSIIGNWSAFIDWGCDGNPIHVGDSVTFNTNGTWTYSYGTGRWVQAEGMVFFNFDKNPGLVYTANVTRNAMVGIMGYATVPPNDGSGCFYFTRIDKTARSPVSKSKRAQKEDLFLSPQKTGSSKSNPKDFLTKPKS